MTLQLQDVVNIARLQLGIPEVRPDDHLVETLSATSADLVNVVATIEERFDIEIDDMDLAGVETVRELYEVAARIDRGSG